MFARRESAMARLEYVLSLGIFPLEDIDIRSIVYLSACSRTCRNAVRASASSGILKTLKFLQEVKVLDERTCEVAAEAGLLKALQWLRQQGCPWDQRTCQAAAKGGHFNSYFDHLVVDTCFNPLYLIDDSNIMRGYINLFLSGLLVWFVYYKMFSKR